MPDNWEESFFRHVGQPQELENKNVNDANDEVQELTTPAVPKLTLYHEAISCLEDALCFLSQRVILTRQMPRDFHAQSD